MQQTRGIQRKMSVSQPNDPHEVEADQMAHTVRISRASWAARLSRVRPF
jgi:hypothetical protein